MSYAEASDALQHVEADLLDDFAAELAAGGQEVVVSTPQLTVLDSAVPGGDCDQPSTTSWLRSLHFNDRLDYVQSCVRVTGTQTCPPKSRSADHRHCPPASGATATHLHLLLTAVGLQRANTEHALEEHLRIAVLGAGGCSVPAYLATALRLPRNRAAEIDAVELNEDVVAAARTYFGIQHLEASDVLPNRLRVHTQCALEWAKDASGKVDVLIVDLQGKPEADGDHRLGTAEVHAPPLMAMSQDFLHSVVKLVGEHPTRPGVVAFNCIATPEGLMNVQERLRHGLSLAKAEQQTEYTYRGSSTTRDDGLQMWVVAPDLEIEQDDMNQQHVLHRVLLFQLGGRLSAESDSQLAGTITAAMRSLGLQPDQSFALQKYPWYYGGND